MRLFKNLWTNNKSNKEKGIKLKKLIKKINNAIIITKPII